MPLFLPCKLCGDLNGKEIQKRGVYECILLIHLCVQQKLIQHCKANKPELKKKRIQHSVQCTSLSISDAIRYYATFNYKELIGYRPSNSMCYKDPRLHFKNMTRVVMKTSTAFPMLLCGFSFQVYLLTNLRPPRMWNISFCIYCVLVPRTQTQENKACWTLSKSYRHLRGKVAYIGEPQMLHANISTLDITSKWGCPEVCWGWVGAGDRETVFCFP